MKRNKDLLNLIPYNGSKNIKTKREYILNYIELKCPATYYNNGRIQCNKMRNRSIRDLYYLTRAKFKTTTIREVCKILFELSRKNEIKAIFCSTVHEVVFFWKSNSLPNFLSNFNFRNHFKEYYDVVSKSKITLN